MRAEQAAETIRLATPRDLDELLALFAAVFGKERSAAVWAWKYERAPAGSVSMVCEAGRRIVAHCGGTIVPFRAGGRVISAIQTVDVMTSGRHASGVAGGGVFARTMLAFFREAHGRGVRMTYGFPGERHRLAGEHLFGYRSAGPVAELVLEPASDGGATSRLRGEDLGEFALRDPGADGLTRDSSWLRWRYLEHPEHRYERVAPHQARAESSAIVRRTDDAVYLMEIGGDAGEDALRALASELATLGRRVVVWCSLAGRLAATLESVGFRRTVRDHSVANLWFRDECDWTRRAIAHDAALDARTFYYTMGDYDVY